MSRFRFHEYRVKCDRELQQPWMRKYFFDGTEVFCTGDQNFITLSKRMINGNKKVGRNHIPGPKK